MGIVTVKGDLTTVLPSELILYIVATPAPWSATHTGRSVVGVLWPVYFPGVDQARVDELGLGLPELVVDVRHQIGYVVTADGLGVGNSEVIVDREIMRGRQQGTILEPLDGRSALARPPLVLAFEHGVLQISSGMTHQSPPQKR